MVAIQIGIIIFLLAILAIVIHDEYKKKRLERKTARLRKFWNRSKERRQSFRLDIELDVLYEAISGEKAQKHTSLSRNISTGGINLALNEKFFPGATLKLQLNIPERPQPVFVQGRVVWVKEMSRQFTEQGGQRIFATGIQFIEITPNDKASLDNFINKRIKAVPAQGQL